MQRTRILICVLSLLLAAASCPVKEDRSELTAYDAGDLTLIFVTEDEGPRRRGTFVDLVENQPTTQQIRLTFPGVKCDQDDCVVVHAVAGDGRVIPIGGVSEGETSLLMNVADLLTGETASQADGGPVRILCEVRVTVGGVERIRRLSGVVYLTVLKEKYRPLACGSPDAAYEVKLYRPNGEKVKNCEAQFSTKGRSAVCGKGC